MTSLKVAETLKELRHHRGFTQKQLSEQLHISRQAYSNYENGTRLPDLETACVIADYFQISLDQLVRVGLHPEKPADPFASLPKDMQDFLSDYHCLPDEKQKRVQSYTQFLRDRCCVVLCMNERKKGFQNEIDHSGILSSCMLHFNYVVSLAAFPASDNSNTTKALNFR